MKQNVKRGFFAGATSAKMSLAGPFDRNYAINYTQRQKLSATNFVA